MIFKSIKLTNFRQFYGESQIEFSQPENGNITLILAENGVGKTTLLQSFRYCFYGDLKNNKYINLPKVDQLFSYKAIRDLVDGQIGRMSVEVHFSHNLTSYIMKRSTEYIKTGDKVIEKESSRKSSLSKSTNYLGMQSLEGEAADLEMLNILPAGLSHVFMFDGERMERKISDKKFKEDLKDSVLGILNLKKYDELIKYLGSEEKTTSVIGQFRNQITSTNEQFRRLDEDNKKTLSQLEDISKLLYEKEEELSEINIKIEEYVNVQRDLQIHEKSINQRDLYESQIKSFVEKINSLSKEVLKIGFDAIFKKELLNIESRFNGYVSSKDDNHDFYQFLHVKTIDEIIERGVCICGESVTEGSEHHHSLLSLRKTALPLANSHYLSYIKSDMMASSTSFNDDKTNLRKLKDDLDQALYQKEDIEHKIDKINLEIEHKEEQLGRNTQKNINELHLEKEKINREIGSLTLQKDALKSKNEKQKQTLKPMIEQSENNRKINTIITRLNEIKQNTTKEKEVKEKRAREILSRHFDTILSIVLSGNYKSTINGDYSIGIKNFQSENDETDVLSTGQSVVVSLSFIAALIDTAKEISELMDSSQKYGVIMDAALSNLDERHTSKVSRYILNEMNQLIFISFKKQVRDEMYESIYDKIGLAYYMEKSNEGVEINRIPMENLNDFVHSNLGENENG